MSWIDERDQGEAEQQGIDSPLNLDFSLFDPWENREHEIVPRPVPDSARSAVPNGRDLNTKDGKNHVDDLMLYVQAVQREGAHAQLNDVNKLTPPGGSTNGGVVPRNKVAKYACSIPGCRKAFTQKTHLDIHNRSHTGEKPYKCPYPGCNKGFSQLCNLKTHKRLHTGEKPFVCTVCGKSFGQKGNLTQHERIHSSEKPLVCKLDGCNKQFTQLGNLKSHHNNAHAGTVRRFSERLKGGDLPKLSAEDREMFRYFTQLYKNCNRGIKGRGKGNKSIKSTEQQLSVRQDMNVGQRNPVNSVQHPGPPFNPHASTSMLPPPTSMNQLHPTGPGANTFPFQPNTNLSAPALSAPPLAYGDILKYPVVPDMRLSTTDSMPPYHVMERWKP